MLRKREQFVADDTAELSLGVWRDFISGHSDKIVVMT
jgi:hypothetical protein